jgi:hypothetical protein
MPYPEPTSVKALLPHDLLLTYADGSRRKFSCAPYLGRGVFARLKNADLFIQARVAGGTVCWPGGLDIAPETLFVRSEPVVQTHTV